MFHPKGRLKESSPPHKRDIFTQDINMWREDTRHADSVLCSRFFEPVGWLSYPISCSRTVGANYVLLATNENRVVNLLPPLLKNKCCADRGKQYKHTSPLPGCKCPTITALYPFHEKTFKMKRTKSGCRAICCRPPPRLVCHIMHGIIARLSRIQRGVLTLHIRRRNFAEFSVYERALCSIFPPADAISLGVSYEAALHPGLGRLVVIGITPNTE